jgi:hypothetical protein
MNQKEILQAAQVSCPEVMAKTAQALALLEKVDPSFVPEVLSDFNTITKFTSEKVASVGAGQAAGLKGFGLAVGGALAAGLATAVSADLYDAARRGLTKGTNFKRIMAANPDLKNYDKARVRASFETLHRYGPEFTADPLMGGSLLKAVAGLEGNEHTLIKDVIKARKEFYDAKKNRFSAGHATILSEPKEMVDPNTFHNPPLPK